MEFPQSYRAQAITITAGAVSLTVAIIGDRQANATKKYASLDCKPFRANSPLLESDLMVME
jgi:hypothetical protein